MKSDLIVFGEDWGRHPSSTQHLVGRLAAERRVLWINSIGMRRPRLGFGDIARAAGKVLAAAGPWAGSSKATSAVPETVTVVSPLVIPWPGSRAAAALNRHLMRRQLLPRLRERKLESPILWTSLPTALPAIGAFGEKAVVYYCGDDFGALAGVDHVPVMTMEQELVDKADLVIAASRHLAARFPRRKTLYVPHGADVGLFARPVAPAADLPLDRPTAGFYGSVAAWIDLDLIELVARRLPHWDVVLVGPVSVDAGRLERLPNVRLLGPRPHDELARYSQHWTVSLLPFRDCPQIQACNPLKLREYLAAGRPVVATPFPALEDYRAEVAIAPDRESFWRAIERAGSRPAGEIEMRRARVAGETWEARARDVDRALAALAA